MSKKHQLPDSLELLLDTMCNTFGGIMFIAISLLVISQFVTKARLTMTSEAWNEAEVKRLEKSIDQLEQQVVDLRRKALENSLTKGDSSPEKDAVIREFIAVRTKNLQLRTGKQTLQGKIAEESAQQKMLAKKLAEAEAKFRDLSTYYVRELKNAQTCLAEQTAKWKSQEAKLRNMVPRELRFSAERNTSRQPYLVLLQNDRIFRYGDHNDPFVGEVSCVRDHGEKSFRLIPCKGFQLGDTPSAELRYLFKGIDTGRYFLWINMDNNSFSSLLALKQYCRARGLQVYWGYNPSYAFSYGRSSAYQASE